MFNTLLYKIYVIGIYGDINYKYNLLFIIHNTCCVKYIQCV